MANYLFIYIIFLKDRCYKFLDENILDQNNFAKMIKYILHLKEKVNH